MKGGESMKEKIYKVTVTYFVCAKSQDRAEQEILMGYGAGGRMKTEELGHADADALMWLENEGGIIHAHNDIQPSDLGFEQPF
jgi:hypothetical protein